MCVAERHEERKNNEGHLLFFPKGGRGCQEGENEIVLEDIDVLVLDEEDEEDVRDGAAAVASGSSWVHLPSSVFVSFGGGARRVSSASPSSCMSFSMLPCRLRSEIDDEDVDRAEEGAFEEGGKKHGIELRELLEWKGKEEVEDFFDIFFFFFFFAFLAFFFFFFFFFFVSDRALFRPRSWCSCCILRF